MKKTLGILKKVYFSAPGSQKMAAKIVSVMAPGLVRRDQLPYSLGGKYPSIWEYRQQLDQSKDFQHKPLISVLLPTYNTPSNYLKECIESVLAQSYNNWELCIADDNSTDNKVREIIKDFENIDKRIRSIFRETNGHISEASNSCLDLAKGEYCLLLDHDDILWPNALFEVVKAINADPKTEFIYSDEDKIGEDSSSHFYPFFKPDWSPDFLESCNYVTHLACIKTSLIEKVGGFRKGYEGAQDWDLFIRIAETNPVVVHIPKILYSWRVHLNSTAHNTDSKPYVYQAQSRLLEDHIARSGINARIDRGIIRQHRAVVYVKSPNYKDVEILVMAPKEEATQLASWSHIKNIPNRRFLDDFSLAKNTNNDSFDPGVVQQALKSTKADYLVVFDPSISRLSTDWLDFLIGELKKEGVAAVGPKITNESGAVLTAGMTTNPHMDEIDLFHGMPNSGGVGVQHLYRDSKRNVAAVYGGLIALKSKAVSPDMIDVTMGSYWDVDLCVGLRAGGQRIVYTPYPLVIAQNLRPRVWSDKLSFVEKKQRQTRGSLLQYKLC